MRREGLSDKLCVNCEVRLCFFFWAGGYLVNLNLICARVPGSSGFLSTICAPFQVHGVPFVLSQNPKQIATGESSKED